MTKRIRRIVELNNKSRKGKYLYIKEKGKHGRYYKIKKNKKAEETLKKAIDNNKGKNKIQDELKKGKTETNLELYKTTGKQANKATSKALEKILVNKKASKLLTKNLHKIINKISYTVVVEGINKTTGMYGTIATITEIGSEEPEKVIERYKKILVKNRVIGSGDSITIKKQLSNKGTIKNLAVNILHQGIIKNVKIRITVVN